MDRRQRVDSIRALIAAGEYRTAAREALDLYGTEPDGYVACLHIQALRKISAEEARNAVQWARVEYKRYPDDKFLRRECCWAIYFGFLRESPEDEEDEDGFELDNAGYSQKRQAARWILDLAAPDDDMVRNLAMFKVCAAAKLAGRWADIVEFTGRLECSRVDPQPKERDGKPIMSDRERWYNLRSRALYETERYGESLALSREATADYPTNQFLLRWLALSEWKTGDAAGGLARLNLVNRRFGPQWYLERDIARVYAAMGDHCAALTWFARAALSPGEIKAKITMLEELLPHLQQGEHWAELRDHLLLIWAIAVQEKWGGRVEKDRTKLVHFLKRHGDRVGGPVELPPPPPQVLQAQQVCSRFWSKLRLASLRQAQGEVHSFDPQRRSGFIKTEGAPSSIKFFRREFNSRVDPKVGQKVEFWLQESWDHTRGQESWLAVQVTPR